MEIGTSFRVRISKIERKRMLIEETGTRESRSAANPKKAKFLISKYKIVVIWKKFQRRFFFDRSQSDLDEKPTAHQREGGR